MSDLVSVTEAARQVGVSRSKLVRHLKEEHFSFVVKGKRTFVRLSAVQLLAEHLKKEGRWHIRAKTSNRRKSKETDIAKNLGKENDKLIDRLNQHIDRLEAENKTLRDDKDNQQLKIEQLISEVVNLKLLPASDINPSTEEEPPVDVSIMRQGATAGSELERMVALVDHERGFYADEGTEVLGNNSPKNWKFKNLFRRKESEF